MTPSCEVYAFYASSAFYLQYQRHDDLVAPTPLQHERKALIDNHLWVTKYAPRCFTDLISDEVSNVACSHPNDISLQRVNRQVLEWVKSWDVVVFGSTEFKSRMAAAAKAAQERAQARRGGRGGGRGGATGSSTTSPEKTPTRAAFVSARGGKAGAGVQGTDRRPEKRILLLHGPPGAGKTTLAHIIAVQAGYRVVEINARLSCYYLSSLLLHLPCPIHPIAVCMD